MRTGEVEQPERNVEHPLLVSKLVQQSSSLRNIQYDVTYDYISFNTHSF